MRALLRNALAGAAAGLLLLLLSWNFYLRTSQNITTSELFFVMPLVGMIGGIVGSWFGVRPSRWLSIIAALLGGLLGLVVGLGVLLLGLF